MDIHLAELNRIFRSEKNPMMGLYAAQLALNQHRPLPSTVAQWLESAIVGYMHGRLKSIDQGLGLVAKGRASPRRAALEAASLRKALARMLWLHCIGANIEQAAVLVARLSPDHAVSKLIDRYRRSGHGATAKHVRASRRVWDDPERELAAYPDGPRDVAQAKAAIRKVYAKHRV